MEFCCGSESDTINDDGVRVEKTYLEVGQQPKAEPGTVPDNDDGASDGFGFEKTGGDGAGSASAAAEVTAAAAAAKEERAKKRAAAAQPASVNADAVGTSKETGLFVFLFFVSRILSAQSFCVSSESWHVISRFLSPPYGAVCM